MYTPISDASSCHDCSSVVPVQFSLIVPTANTVYRRGGRGTEPVEGKSTITMLVTRTRPQAKPGLKPSIFTDATTEPLKGKGAKRLYQVATGRLLRVVFVGSQPAFLEQVGERHLQPCHSESPRVNKRNPGSSAPLPQAAAYRRS